MNIEYNGINAPAFEPRVNASFNSLQLTHSEVHDILRNLKLGKASGSDLVSHQLLKYTSDATCRPLSVLFNLSLKENKFPSSWKKATVIPLFKMVIDMKLQITDRCL